MSLTSGRAFNDLKSILNVWLFFKFEDTPNILP